MDTFKGVIGGLLSLFLIGLGLFMIGLIFWTSYQDWKAKGRPIDIDKWRKDLFNSFVAICATIGFLVILDWFMSCSK